MPGLISKKGSNGKHQTKASKAPFLTLRVATPSGAPRQAPLELVASAAAAAAAAAAWLGRTPKVAYSSRGRSRHLLKTPFSEPLLRTLLRTLFYCKAHSRPPSQNPSENPFPRTLPRTFSEPFSERCVAVRPLRRAPNFRERKRHKHKQMCGIVPGLGGWQILVYVFFSGHSLRGRKNT